MAELKACPFNCGEKIEPPFENLVDTGEEDGMPVSCWTIRHDCPVTHNEIWVTAMTADECADQWNTRPPASGVAEELRAIVHPNDLADLKSVSATIMNDARNMQLVAERIAAALATGDRR